jgi:hypothetical protein
MICYRFSGICPAGAGRTGDIIISVLGAIRCEVKKNFLKFKRESGHFL